MKKTLTLYSQLSGNGGIPRFNRNFKKVFDDEVVHLSLNDEYEKNKIRFVFSVIKYIIFNQPKIIIVGHLNFAFLAFLKIFSPRAKVIIIIHGIDAWFDRGKLKWFYPFVNEFWSVSEYTCKKFNETNQVPLNKIKKIFNTLPDQWIEQSNSLLAEHQAYFFSVTRLEKSENYKGIKETIEAVAQIQDFLRTNQFQYKILASGDALEEHKKWALSLGVQDIVSFQSNLSDEELVDLYKNCSFFILPSTGEGFGIVFLEAMAFDKTCIGAINCGSEDVIDNNKTGFLIEQDINVIKEKILYLINNPDENIKMGKAGKEKLLKEFTFQHFEHKIKNLIKSCAE